MSRLKRHMSLCLRIVLVFNPFAVWLYLHSRHWKYPVYLHSQEEKHRNANTIIEIVVTRKVYILQISHDVRQDSTLFTNVDQCV